MSELNQQKEDIIRGEVIEAAQKLFQKYGFTKTTMEDIAKVMGRGKSTLYYYYKSKEEIFEAVIMKEADEVVNAVMNAVQKKSSAVEKLEAYLLTSFDTVKKKINLYGIMKEEIFDDRDATFCRPTMQKPIKQYNTREREMVKNILLLGIENDEFVPELRENVDLSAYVIITSLRSIAVDLAFSEKDLLFYIEADKINAIIAILLRGIRR